MSITFYCPEAPSHFVTPYPDEPEYQEEQSVLPSLNLAQSSAFAFLRLLGLPEQSEGHVEVSELPDVSRQLIRVVNSRSARRLEYARRSELKNGKVKVIDFGFGDEYLQRKATELLDLFAKARERNFKVVWS